MPRRDEHDALVIVLDVGKTVSELNVGENKSFVEKSKDCVSWILQRKLIAQSKDHVALVLMGTDETDNALDQDVYENIACKFDFQRVSWDMLKFIETQVKSTNKVADWIKALVVSLDLLKNHEEEYYCLSKRIVFFSDFTNPANDELPFIMRAIKKKEINITIIGPEVNPEIDESDEPPSKRFRSENDVEKTEARRRGEQLIAEMSKELEGLIQLSTFDRALKQLSSYAKKSVSLRPWNAVLDIGEVEIKISAYKKTDTKSDKKFDTRYLKPSEPNDPSQPSTSTSRIASEEAVSVVKDKVMHYSHQNKVTNEIEEVAVQEGEITEGYKYGTTIVPFSAEDKENLGYKAGPKSLSILGFTSKDTFPMYLLTGECVYVITGKDKDEHSETALSAIIQAMNEENYVAVARKVYSDDRGLSLCVLYPKVEEIEGEDGTYYKECLLLIEIAFHEEVKSLEFGSLEPVAKTITPAQYECVDKLIDEMDLMTADRDENEEPCEALEWSNLHEIKNQFFQYCVIQRGLYPDRPIPKELPPRFKEFVTLPKTLIQKNKDLGLALKQLFTIEVKEEKKPDLKGKNVMGQKIDVDNKNKVDVFSRIKKDDDASSSNGFNDSGIVNDSLELSEPSLENDFKRLFNKKEHPKETAIDNLIKYYHEDMGSSKEEIIKVLVSCISSIRQRGVNGIPEDYNFWLIKFKRFCCERGGIWLEIWELIVSDNLGLISNKENKNSRATEDEAEQFLRSKITPSPAVQTPKKKPEFGTIPESADAAEKNEAMDMLF